MGLRRTFEFALLGAFVLACAWPGRAEAAERSAQKSQADERAKPAKKEQADRAAAGGAATKKPSKSAKRSTKPAARPTKPTKSRRKTSRRSTRRTRPKPRPRRPGSKPGQPDEAARQALRRDPPGPAPHESAELKAMRELDHLLFPPSSQPTSPSWARDTIDLDRDRPRIDPSGLPQRRPLPEPSAQPEPTRDLGWLATLRKPDIPVRWEPPVVRYLEYYKTNPRGRKLLRRWIQRSGRYRDHILGVLRQQGLPEDLLWVALVESAFSATAYSRAGAAGLWQFMPTTGRIYGLTVDRRYDERLDPARSTLAAARHLGDLHARFRSWELAFAAYNMGYGGLLASIRKYNTNDFWELSRLEAALPYETALYVPKIMAVAVAARNCDVFGCQGVELDPAEPIEELAVGPGVRLQTIAKATRVDEERLRALNPQLLGSRTPPLEIAPSSRKSWSIYLPKGKRAEATDKLKAAGSRQARWATTRVRWGESLEHIAAEHGTSAALLQRLNDLGPGENPRPHTALFVPRQGEGRASSPDEAEQQAPKPVVVVPDQEFGFTDRRRVFYRVINGDRLTDVARVCGVSAEALRRWNHLDPHAALQGGMVLQLFVARRAQLPEVLLREEESFRVLVAGSDAFIKHFERKKGRRRIEVTVAEGDTWKKLSKRYGLSLGMLERINHRSRRSTLTPGETVVIYTRRPPREPASASSGAQPTS